MNVWPDKKDYGKEVAERLRNHNTEGRTRNGRGDGAPDGLYNATHGESATT